MEASVKPQDREPIQEPKPKAEPTPAEEGPGTLRIERDFRTEVFWVEGKLAARGICEDLDGSLYVEGIWPGIASCSLRLAEIPAGSSAWVFEDGRGHSLTLRADGSGAGYLAEIQTKEGTIQEHWLPQGDPQAKVRAQAGFGYAVEVEGTPLELEFAIVSEDPAFADLDGLVYMECLGRLPIGNYAGTWPGLDRRAERRALPPGTYRIELRERRYLQAPGSTRDPNRVLASTSFRVR